MNTLGVILARAGSAGLRNKHLLPLLGRPVIRYTFDHVRVSRRLTRVVVSTDCPEIRKLATQSGLPAIDRPPQLATADASVQDVMLHAMAAVEAEGKFQADALIVLYGNCPVRPAGAIDRAIDMLESTGCDSIRSFCPVGKWHPAWMSRLDGDRVVPLRPGSIHRRQDLEPLLLHDGAVVAVSRKAMLAAAEHRGDPHAFFGADRRGFQVEAGATVEIDQLRDLYWAEAVLRETTEPLKRAS
ncbi:MAG TPA: acylneuraminate cytidylyltransferase family protein [Tepidisphaeraceae bacterium]|jgi:CMP-N-acetylneuraminic acid synthetase|nr:acylneuraminate cytidylyltransferase family protein [Tepidisphaeraceae bacterium]